MFDCKECGGRSRPQHHGVVSHDLSCPSHPIYKAVNGLVERLDALEIALRELVRQLERR